MDQEGEGIEVLIAQAILWHYMVNFCSKLEPKCSARFPFYKPSLKWQNLPKGFKATDQLPRGFGHPKPGSYKIPRDKMTLPMSEEYKTGFPDHTLKRCTISFAIAAFYNDVIEVETINSNDGNFRMKLDKDYWNYLQTHTSLPENTMGVTLSQDTWEGYVTMLRTVPENGHCHMLIVFPYSEGPAQTWLRRREREAEKKYQAYCKEHDIPADDKDPKSKIQCSQANINAEFKHAENCIRFFVLDKYRRADNNSWSFDFEYRKEPVMGRTAQIKRR